MALTVNPLQSDLLDEETDDEDILESAFSKVLSPEQDDIGAAFDKVLGKTAVPKSTPVVSQEIAGVEEAFAKVLGGPAKPSLFKEVPLGALETIGGLAAGGIEWFAGTAMGLGSAAAVQMARPPGYENTPTEDIVKESQQNTAALFESLKDWAPESVSRFIGKPQTPAAQNILGAVSKVLENTVGVVGGSAGRLVGTILDESKKQAESLGSENIAEVIEATAPYVQELTKFGVELGTFKAAHAAGKYVVRRVKNKDVLPESKPVAEITEADWAEIAERDFTPDVARENIVKDIVATEAVEVAKPIEVKPAEPIPTKLTEVDKANLLKTARDTATKVNAERTIQDVKDSVVTGKLSKEVGDAVIAEIEYSAEQRVKISEVQKVEDIAAAKLPGTIGASTDPVSGKQLPFGTRNAAMKARQKYAAGGEEYKVVKVPGEKAYMLEPVKVESSILVPSKTKLEEVQKAAPPSVVEPSETSPVIKPEARKIIKGAQSKKVKQADVNLRLYKRAQELSAKGANNFEILGTLEKEFKLDFSDIAVRIAEFERTIATPEGNIAVPEKWRNRISEKFDIGEC